MRELTQIIDTLHIINEQIVEKDNIINGMTSLVTVVTQMIHDATFIKSDAYTDLRVKYLTQIDTFLEKIGKKQITIEPENLDLSVKKQIGKKTFTKENVNAPIKTDIFSAPSCRRIFNKKKIEKKDESDTKETELKKYVSFDYNENTYYIDLIAKLDQYHIYDDNFTVVGNLKGSVVTMITDTDLLTTETITLKTAIKNDNEYLFGNYFVDNV